MKMESITIRRFNDLDIKNFNDLCGEDDWCHLQAFGIPKALLKYVPYRENCFVAYDAETFVGFVYGGVLCDTLYPQFMYVKKNYRKRGIGKALMEKLELESGCNLSMIFYHKTLKGYYRNQGYTIGTELEVAIKQLEGNTL